MKCTKSYKMNIRLWWQAGYQSDVLTLTLVDRKIRPDSMQDHMHLLVKRMKNF